MNKTDFGRRLRVWFRRHGRDLPWRQTRDPYAILVSEMMLQQTTVAAVVPYFERWMKRFPSVEKLAAAGESEVLTLWQGLGYYRRARNLHASAKKIDGDWSGKFPQEYESLRALPGIGDYTAQAVRAFAYDEAVLVLDANTGQNAIQQAKLFSEVAPLTGLVLTKLDCTAKGGAVLGIADEVKVPIYFIGIGEAVEDLRAFEVSEFVEALF